MTTSQHERASRRRNVGHFTARVSRRALTARKQKKRNTLAKKKKVGFSSDDLVGALLTAFVSARTIRANDLSQCVYWISRGPGCVGVRIRTVAQPVANLGPFRLHIATTFTLKVL